MSTLRFNDNGLIPAILQDRLTGDVRMFAWMNREALAKTLESGRATFFSRSRGRLWEKGETSGNTLRVVEVFADCDEDVLLLLADPVGPSCHTGRPTCFFRRVTGSGETEDVAFQAGPFLGKLENELEQRQSSTAQKSYTKSLLDGGPTRIGDKLREEADELSAALASESDERVLSEAADVLYHLLVALRLRGLSWRSVIEVLAGRRGVSGHTEKARRSAPPRST